MASFNQQQNSFAEIQEYTPDFNFLTRGYAAKQAQYDRGFNAVKSFYNSILNKDVTNPENKKYREDAYKKIQSSIKSLSSVDLSNPANIQQAQSILNPIAQDKDIIYDMYITGKNNEAKQQMEMYKNSMDPEQRAKYNDYSALNIQFAEEDLANAQRGNGSIQQVRPGEFVPFDDVNKYLNDVAKEQKLEIKYDELSNGYILKHTNGERVSQNFTSWAIQQMGNKFDRQFQLMGKVESETAIRGLMKTLGYDRETAINKLGEKQKPVFIQYQAEQLNEIDTNLREYKNQLKIIDAHYKNGVPTSLKQQYAQLQQVVSSLEQAKLNKENDIKTIANSDNSYIVNNLSGYLSQTYKQETASRWGKTYATANEELQIMPDAMAIAKYNNSIKVMLDREHQQLERQKMSMDYQFKTAEMQMKGLELKAKGLMPNEELVGGYVATNKLSSVDIILDDYRGLHNKSFNTVFGTNGGLLDIVEPNPNDRAVIKSALNNLNRNIDDPSKLSDNDKKILSNYAQQIGAKEYITPANKEQAELVLELLSVKTYEQAEKNAPLYKNINKGDKLANVVASSIQALADFKAIYNKKSNFYRDFKSIANIIQDENGNLRDGYENAVVVDRIGDVNVYDLSGVEPEFKDALSSTLPANYTKKENVVSPVYNFNGLTTSEINSMLNENISSVVAEGSKFNLGILKSLTPNEQKELIDKGAQVTFDAANKKAIIKINPALTSSIAGKFKMNKGEEIVLEIPYGTIEANRNILPRFFKYSQQNTVRGQSLGMFEEFASNPYASFKSNQIMSNMGFDYLITGDTDRNGNYGVNVIIDAMDPDSKKKQQVLNTFYPIDEPNNPDSYLFLEDNILKASSAYSTGLVNLLNTEDYAE